MMNKIAMPQLFVLPRWFNVAGWAVFICVVGMTFSKTGRALFSAHPICMTLGCAGFMTEAIGAYRTPGVKAVQRRQHRILQMSAAAALLLGTSVILVNKAFVKQPPSSVVPHTIHAWTGALALVGVAAQVWMGVRKHAVIVASGEKTFKFHGKLGNTVYLLCCLAMLLGVLSHFKNDETPPKSTLMAKVVATAMIVLGAVVFLSRGPPETQSAAATAAETEPMVNSI